MIRRSFLDSVSDLIAAYGLTGRGSPRYLSLTPRGSLPSPLRKLLEDAMRSRRRAETLRMDLALKTSVTKR